MVMYKTRSWGASIEEVEIVRRTPQSVYYMRNGKERREIDTYYFETKELAKKSIIERECYKVAKAQINLESAQKELLEITKQLL